MSEEALSLWILTKYVIMLKVYRLSIDTSDASDENVEDTALATSRQQAHFVELKSWLDNTETGYTVEAQWLVWRSQCSASHRRCNVTNQCRGNIFEPFFFSYFLIMLHGSQER